MAIQKKPAVATTEDPLASHREQVMYPIALLAAVFLFPFGLRNLALGHYALGGAILAVVILLALAARAIRQRRRPPIPYALLLVPVTFSIVMTLKLQGIYGALWCYPATLFFYFVLSRRHANLCVSVLLLTVTLMAYRYIGPALTIRFIISLIITVAIINIILNVISDLHRRLLDQAIKDPLTDAYNRRYMEARMREAVGNSRRRGAPVSILLLDVDHFKSINDRYGHEGGDEVLRNLVKLIARRLRKTDLLFRIGGEEFLVLLPDTGEDEAVALAEELRMSIAGATLIEGSTVHVSMGVSQLRSEETRRAWMRATDAALYAAKRGGRNRVLRRAAQDEAAPAPPSAAPVAGDPSVPA
jgi:diguanylate cyclase (GGDEF)-like protein